MPRSSKLCTICNSKLIVLETREREGFIWRRRRCEKGHRPENTVEIPESLLMQGDIKKYAAKLDRRAAIRKAILEGMTDKDVRSTFQCDGRLASEARRELELSGELKSREAIRDSIRAGLLSKTYSRRKLAKMIGVSPTTVNFYAKKLREEQATAKIESLQPHNIFNRRVTDGELQVEDISTESTQGAGEVQQRAFFGVERRRLEADS